MIANPYRFIGDYIVYLCEPGTDVDVTTAHCLEKAKYYQAHIVLIGNCLTLKAICDIVSSIEAIGQRNRVSYAISEDLAHIDNICKDAILVVTAKPSNPNG